jgi:hypothetical protein
MKRFSAALLTIFVVAGCVSQRDASYAPGGVKTIVPFAINKWQAPVLIANHLYYDRESRVIFDIQIDSIDGKTFTGDGRRTKFYYHVDPGPHVIAVSCVLAKVTWAAEFDFILDAGDTVEITGELIEDGLFLWFADVNTGLPVTEKIRATEQPKKVGPVLAPTPPPR